jgi:hypothetical protein
MANNTNKAHLTFNACKKKLTMGIPKYIGKINKIEATKKCQENIVGI